MVLWLWLSNVKLKLYIFTCIIKPLYFIFYSMPIPPFKPNRSWKQTRPQQTFRPLHSQMKNIRRAGRGSFIKGILPYALIALALGLLLALTTFAWFSRDLPRPDKIIDRSIAKSTKIFDRTGENLLFEAHGAENRTVIKLEDIPEYLKWSTILVEDKKFYEHQGFDLKGIFRAVVLDVLTLSKSQGGSTLTQQLIKNALLSNEKAWSRKIK